VCPDFDMCEKCEAQRLHPAEHALIKLRTERQLPAHLPPFFQGDAPAGPSGGCPRRGGGGSGRCGRYRAAAAEVAGAKSEEAKEPFRGCPMFAQACARSAEESSAVPATRGPQAVLLRHVTLAHGSKLEQGQVLVKTWSVQNNGAESWPAESKLIFLRGDREFLGETEEFSVVPAQTGQTVEISVPITTPTKPGSYAAYFQLADAGRNVFGPRLWLEVVVTRDDEDERKLAPSGSVSNVLLNTNTSSSLSAPIVDTSGWIDVKVETSPVIKPVAAPVVVPATTLPPVSAPAPVTASVAPVPTPAKPVVVAPTVKPASPAPKFAAQLASLASMGFNNAELNSFLLEKHNGDIQQVSNWLLENMNH